MDEWFRNRDWDEQIESAFETRLKRARGDYSKSQYLKIQASYLLDSQKKNVQKKGIELTKQLIESFPNETFNTIAGIEQLGDFYFRNKNYELAEQQYRIVTDYYHTETRSGTSGIADLKLCETILVTRQEEKFREAYNLATIKFKEGQGSLLLNNRKFYYANLMANLCDQMNRSAEAVQFAKEALQLAAIKEPQFNRHKSIGVVEASNKQLSKLESIIVAESDARTHTSGIGKLNEKIKRLFK